jgi:AcrR family transcriptional regulator
MKKSSRSVPAATAMHDRILGASFEAFTGEGYAGTSTLDIARRAKVSKRNLYANFGSKHAVLVACIKNRAESIPPGVHNAAYRFECVQGRSTVIIWN